MQLPIPFICRKHPKQRCQKYMRYLLAANHSKTSGRRTARTCTALSSVKNCSSGEDCFSVLLSSWKLFPHREEANFCLCKEHMLCSYQHKMSHPVRSLHPLSSQPTRSYLKHQPCHFCCAERPNNHSPIRPFAHCSLMVCKVVSKDDMCWCDCI